MNRTSTPRRTRVGTTSITLLAALVTAVASVTAEAKVFLTQDEALKLVFEDAAIERKVVYLSEAELKRASELAGHELPSALVTRYVAVREGKTLGTAYFDSHVVRTLAETLMIVVAPDGKVRRIEVLSFAEPPEYLPRAEWYGQFNGQELGTELELKKAIHPVTGASLTARVTVDAVRRALAIHRTLTESSER